MAKSPVHEFRKGHVTVLDAKLVPFQKFFLPFSQQVLCLFLAPGCFYGLNRPVIAGDSIT